MTNLCRRLRLRLCIRLRHLISKLLILVAQNKTIKENKQWKTNNKRIQTMYCGTKLEIHSNLWGINHKPDVPWFS